MLNYFKMLWYVMKLYMRCGDRQETVNCLGMLWRKPPVRTLVHALADDDWLVRMKAVKVLARTVEPSDKRAVEPLIHALRDEHEDIRATAAEALGKLGDTRAFDSLLLALQKDWNEDVRKNAAYALGELGDTRAVETLIAHAFKIDWREYSVCDSATLALGKFDDAQTSDLLSRALQDHKGLIHVSKFVGEILNRSYNTRVAEVLKEAIRMTSDNTKRHLEWLEKDREQKKQEDLERVTQMSVSEFVNVLTDLCRAYEYNDSVEIERLEAMASKIGRILNERGGVQEMRRIFKMVPDVGSRRTLEMHWEGIGDWRG
jgi:hypothetical protein